MNLKTPALVPSLAQLPQPPIGREGWPWTEPPAFPVDHSETAWPVISLVVPSFQQGRTLEGTLRSILLQGYPSLELWVIDGGSTDETVAVLKKYERWLSSWVSEPDRGQSHAINKGLARCTGSIFNWINSDDYLYQGVLLKVATRWIKTQPDWLVGRCRSIQEDTGECLHDWIPRPPSSIDDFFQPNRVVLPQPSTFIRTDLMKQLAGVRENLHYVMDWELYLRVTLAASKKAVVVDDYLSAALVHPLAKTTAHPERSRPEAIEALRTLELTLTDAPRRRLQKCREAMELQDAVSRALSLRQGMLLVRLAFQFPAILTYRFYWGGLWRVIRGRSS